MASKFSNRIVGQRLKLSFVRGTECQEFIVGSLPPHITLTFNVIQCPRLADRAGQGSPGGVPHAPRLQRLWRRPPRRLLRAPRLLHHRDGAARALQGPFRLHHREERP